MRKDKSRYDTSGMIEAEFEPGSGRRVLKNLLGVNRKRAMDRVEWLEQLRALDDLVDIYGKGHRFSASDIRKMHKLWLGKIYKWAGGYRSVNMSKDGFPFAGAAQIPKLMSEFEDGPLRELTPCIFNRMAAVAHALAVVHVELVLIHPFREGNGRLARILSTLMALQAGLPPLDFGSIKGKRKREYFAAVQAGMAHNYKPMERIFSDVIGRTLRTRGKRRRLSS